MNTNQIIDVDGYVHVVGGAVVCYERHMFSPSSEGDRAVVLREASKVRGTGKVRILTDLGDDTGNYMADTLDTADLPAPVQDRIRAALAALEKGAMTGI